MISAAHESTQRGSVLVLLLLLLTGMGATWFAQVGSNRLHLAGDVPVNTASAMKLKDAQQALLSYSALYPFLYGPRSAGPGHLPCPDTDTASGIGLMDVPPGEMRTSGFSQDGPNPPCGSTRMAIGKLPRHVLLADQRYMFHSEPNQHMRYQVSGSYINNPTNRVFNVGLPDSDELGALTIAATLNLLASSSSAWPVSLPITQRAMLQGIKPSVAAWIIHKARKKRAKACARADGLSNLNNPDTSGAANSSSETVKCFTVQAIKPRCVEDAVLSLIVDGQTHGEHCLTTMLDQLTIDEVPANRHWFIRNNWMSWIQISTSPVCSDQSSIPCELHFDFIGRGDHDALVDARKVHLQWLP